MKRTRLVGLGSGLLLLAAVAQAQGQAQAEAPQAPAGPERWEAAVQKFEEADRQNRPADGAFVFIGASSIVRWTNLAQDFPGMSVLNRGYGGSVYRDLTPYIDRILVPYKPRKVVIYSGDNDLARGMTPEEVLADFKELIQVIHTKLPQAQVGVIAVKPSIRRWALYKSCLAVNAVLRELDKQDDRMTLIDIEQQMLGPDGQPNPELFVPDGLHLSPKGYEVWTAAVMPFLKQ
jgi:lysophospholipase L1-like esterase